MHILGHTKTLSHLKQLVQSSQLPHALLFTGPTGIGKKLVAHHFVQTLFCEKQTTSPPHPSPLTPHSSPCENCKNCLRVANRQHPDLFWIEPEKDLIKIDTIRNLKNSLALKPYEAPLKIAIIVDAHCLNIAASNALLKTLEEPPPDTVLILISSTPHQLLKTILSRCQKIYFSPLSAEETREVVRQKGGKIDPTLILQSGGQPGLALSFSEEACEIVKDKILPVFDAQPKDLLTLFSVAEEIAPEEELHKPILNLLLIRWKEKILANPLAGEVKKFDAIEQALRRLDHYANPLLTFENLFLNLCL
jgi:DNA polymerase-3 subunit delta'